MSCPIIIFSEKNQTYHTHTSCYYILDLFCVTNFSNEMVLPARQDLENEALDLLATWASCQNIYFWVLPTKQIVKFIFEGKF